MTHDETGSEQVMPNRSARTPRYSRQAAYLLCRTLGHAWMPIAAEHVGRLGGDPLWLRCERCDTERHDSISRTTGDLMTRQYVYDDSYRHAFDESFADAAPSRADFRRMLLTEAIIKARNARALQQAEQSKQQPTQRNGAA